MIGLVFSGCLSRFDVFDKTETLASVKAKIESGVDVDAQDAFGKTLLLSAVENENFEIVEYLVEEGADLDLTADDGRSPLIIAAEKANFDIIKKLVTNGVNINYQMLDNSYALYKLVGNQDIHSKKDYVMMAKYMIDHGAKYDMVGFNNYFLIHASRDVKMIEYLSSLGLDIYAFTENNATSLIGSIANQGEGTEVTEYLINKCVNLQAEATFDGKKTNAYTMALRFKRYEAAKLILDAINNPPKQCIDGYVEANVVPPLIKFYTSKDANGSSITIELKAQDNGIGNVSIFLNDVELDTDESVKLIRANAEEKVFNIKLENGTNDIKVYAYDETDEVRSNAVFHTVIGEEKPYERPNLYAVVIGVDDFKAEELDLKYAQADALLFGSTLFKRARELFSKVNVIYLKNEKDTTKESILNELKKLNDISPNDLFVFYAATLGTNIENKYYMMTSDISSIENQYLQENALSEDELRNAFKSIPAENKLLLFDTSYAGNVTKSIASKLVDNSLKPINLSSITATGPTHITLEGYADGHSTFAYLISDALDGEADVNNDKIVNSKEMISYVVKNLPLEVNKYNHIQSAFAYENGDAFNLAKVRAYKQEVEVEVVVIKKEPCVEVKKEQTIEPEPEDEIEIEEPVLDKTYDIGKFNFEFKNNSIFIASKDELKNHFNYINAQGETLIVFDFYSNSYIPYAEELIETDKVTKIEIGYHEEFYRIVLYTKIKQTYEYISTDDGIQINLKDEK